MSKIEIDILDNINPSVALECVEQVVDEIEKFTNNQNWCAFPKQSHKELKELIEQLKK